MSPDTAMQIIIIANPVLIVLAGFWGIILGKRMGRRIFLIIGILTCIAAPICLILEIILMALYH